MVSPTPLSSNVARKIERSRRVSAKTGDPAPGRRASQIGSAVAARRMASRRAVRPSRAVLATVAASRGTFAVRRFESIGRRPRSATARRARVGARGGIALRSAPSGGPARARPHGLAPRGAHPAVRENPIETPRPPSPALRARAVHGAPLQLPRVVDRRSTSRSELPSRAKSTAQVSSSPSSFPMARSPRRNRVEGGRPDVPTKGGVAARLLGVSPRSSPGAPAPSCQRASAGDRATSPRTRPERAQVHISSLACAVLLATLRTTRANGCLC